MYKRRRAVLIIDLTQLQEWDAFTLGAILQELPEDTKVASFGGQVNEAKLAFVIENEKFKDVNISESYPRVYVSETHRVDCSAIMEQVEEKKKQPFDPDTTMFNAMYGIAASNFDAWKSKPVTHGRLTAESIRKAQELAFNSWRGIVVEDPKPVYYSNVIPPDEFPPSITTDTEEYLREEYQRMVNRLHLQINSGIMPGTTKTPNLGCAHTWKPYEGLTEKYEFCEKCNERKA